LTPSTGLISTSFLLEEGAGRPGLDGDGREMFFDVFSLCSCHAESFICNSEVPFGF